MARTVETTNERRVVPIDEAIRRIGRRKNVHTFVTAPFGLVGADHDRKGLIRDMELYGVEDSGEQAAAMGHTLVIVNYQINGRRTPLFIEAAPAKPQPSPCGTESPG